MYIYKITNEVNGKAYVGQTVRTIEERFKEHLRHDSLIGKAIRKYGVNNFTVEQIDEAETIESLNEKEIYWISFFNCISPNGYNLCAGGGNTSGYHHTDESKVRMSEAHRGTYIGESNHFYGKHHDEAARLKMGEKRKGLSHLTEEQIFNFRKSHVVVKVVNLDTGEVFESIKDAAAKYEIEPTHITRVCKGKRKSCGGFRWSYV